VRTAESRPWWLEEAPPDEPAPPLAGDHTADVAIVGGGYTGLWTALSLKRRDPERRVAVVEAKFVGHGPSGRNGGFLHGWWSSLPSLQEVFGDAAALELARASAGCVAAVRGLDEDVWLREGGLLKVSAAPAQDDEIEHSVQVAAAAGVPEEAVALSSEQVAERCRSPIFRAGVLYRDGSTVQPARLVRALRRAALGAGVELYEQSPARLRHGRVETSDGTLRAPELVLAINAWAVGWRPLARRLTSFGSFVVLTEPVPDLLREIGWTGGEPIIDGRMFLHYFRTTEDGRVLMGSGSGPIRAPGRLWDDRPSVARAEAGLRRLLPALREARIEAAWGGPIDVSADRFPFVGTLPGQRIHYAAGFSGNGVGPSWLAGQVLAARVLGADDEWSRLPLERRTRGLPPEPLKRVGGSLVRAAALRAEQAEEAGRRPALWARAGAAVPRLFGIRLGLR
jgi:glycine/D-amino acid oxidase-like deaminating enzyme